MENKTLKDTMPNELNSTEYNDTRAYKMKDIRVIEEYGDLADFEPRAWPGTHKNVYFWVVLENGYAVGWNENPARGWSFPVIKFEK